MFKFWNIHRGYALYEEALSCDFYFIECHRHLHYSTMLQINEPECTAYILSSFNPLRTSPDYNQAGIYGKCVLQQNQIVFNELIVCSPQTAWSCESLHTNRWNIVMLSCRNYEFRKCLQGKATLSPIHCNAHAQAIALTLWHLKTVWNIPANSPEESI